MGSRTHPQILADVVMTYGGISGERLINGIIRELILEIYQGITRGCLIVDISIHAVYVYIYRYIDSRYIVTQED